MSEELESIRKGIDRIDSRMIKLLRSRSRLVSAAGKHKKDENAVRDDKRVEAVIEKVRTLAVKEGLDPEIAEKVYRTMIGAFIEQELSETGHGSEKPANGKFGSILKRFGLH